MKKIILVPDSFKGTLSSSEICRVMVEVISRHFPEAEVVSLPIADGGEGSVDCFLEAVGGTRRSVKVKGPFFEDMETYYGLIDGGKTAVVEMAACAGLPLVEGRKDPCKTTTFGVGQILLAAAEARASKIVLGLGGSATNDCGCGAAAACGVIFRKSDGATFIPTGGSLKDIADVDMESLNPALSGVEITAMCDIDNPAYGESGAAHIFGPQKGASPADVLELDAGVRHLCALMREKTGADLASVPGAGAAGAMGFGMMAFFGAKLRMGIETVLDTVGFDEKIIDADLVITGEGKLDGQSLRGKVLSGVGRRAAAAGVPALAVVGGSEDCGEIYERGINAVFSINRLPEPLELSRPKSAENLAYAVDNIMRLIKILKKSLNRPN